MTFRGILIVPLREFKPEINGRIVKIIWVKYNTSLFLFGNLERILRTLMSCFYYVISIVLDPLKFNMMRGYMREQEILMKNFFCVGHRDYAKF
jgi:hypothetical protein